MKSIYKYPLLSVVFLAACASHMSTAKNTMNTLNEKLIKEKSPLRYVLDEGVDNANFTRIYEYWAGQPGKSAINTAYTQMVLSNLQQHCGFRESDLIEVRVVEHLETTWEEVWLFKDELSHRDDKISGLTLFFRYNPEKDITTAEPFGACHTGKGTSFTFSK